MSGIARSPGQTAMRTWARKVVALSVEGGAGPEPKPLDIVGAVAAAVAAALPGTEFDAASLPGCTSGAGAGAAAVGGRLPEPPNGWSDPWLPGLVHEQAVSAVRRSARGAWYTPQSVVRGLVDLATADDRFPSSIIDPTCGGGAFLLAALDRYRRFGLSPAEALSRVAGSDIDPDAVCASRWSLQLWAAGQGVIVDPDDLDLRVADVLDGRDSTDGLENTDGPDRIGQAATDGLAGRLVIGNPPFATPLRSGRFPAAAEAYRSANRELLGPYSDLAAIHLLAALRSAGPDSTVALILPQSVLSGRDTEALREHCDREAPLQALWATRDSVFDAGVRACAVVVAPGGSTPDAVRLAAGPQVEPVDRRDRLDPEPGRWAPHAARALGAPALPKSLTRRSASTLGDLVTATAGFRDEYYGLVAACREWDGPIGTEPNRLATVGSIDPLLLGWGHQDCRLGGRHWRRPVIDVEVLDDKVRSWVEQRLTPQVVLATQSRVLEPVVDRRGHLIPATPLIAVSAPADQLDLVAAVLLAPPVVAWAWQRWFGASLSVDAVKLAARQVLELPLPDDRGAWEQAASLVAAASAVDSADRAADRRADDDAADKADGATDDDRGRSERAFEVARRVAEIMNRAYGADDDALEWWVKRAGSGPGASAELSHRHDD